MERNKVTVYDSGSNLKLELRIYDNGETKWDCKQTIIKKWPLKFKERYSTLVKYAAKTYEEDDVIKLKRFFYARGVLEDKRLFQELFRGINLGISREEQNYIDETIDMASRYYGINYDGIKNELLHQKIAI